MIKQFLDYATSFFSFAGRRAAIAFALVFAGGLLEGIGLLFLVPFLELFAGNAQSELSVKLSGILQSLGLYSRESHLLAVLGGFLVVLFTRNIIAWLRDTRIQALSFGFVDQWRARLFNALANAPWPQITQLQRTDIEHAITNDVARLSIGTDRILRGGVSLVMLIIQIAIAFYLSPALTALVLTFIMGAAFMLSPLIARARVLGEFVTRAGRGVHGVLGDFLSGLKLAKTHDAETVYVNRFNETTRALRQKGLKFTSDQALSRAIFHSVSGIVACAVIVIGALYLKTPVPVLVVILLIMGRLTGPFLTLIQGAQQFANMLPAFHSLRAMEASLVSSESQGSRPPPTANETTQTTDKPDTANRARAASIEFQNVSFHHSGQSENVLSDVSMTIDPGDLVVLVGPSGAGKTTLIDIIVGLHRPTSGQVILDGKPVGDAGPDSQWRRGLAYVPQDPFLFDLSLRQNLTWPEFAGSNANHTDEAIWDALRMAGAHDFVNALKDDLDTRAGERGQSFSGGERQRLCLARAILRKPRLLVLDEATNAIDFGLEKELLERLEKLRGQMTIITITHRHASVQNADKVFVLHGGRLTAKNS